MNYTVNNLYIMLRAMQDPNLMLRTQERCRVISDFVDGVLVPLQKNRNLEPFHGFSADANSFGWGFSSASSRALRNPSFSSTGAVMVPLIDIASHSCSPTCTRIYTLIQI